MNNNNYTIGTAVYGVLLLTGALLAVFDVAFAVWVFASGAIWALVQTLVYALRNRSDNWREARLHRLSFVASLLWHRSFWDWRHGSCGSRITLGW